MNRKTQGQRDAINKRADAYPRPISAGQHGALREMAKGSLHHWRRGYGPSIERCWPSRTIAALELRGLCEVRGAAALITAAGRRELARRR